MSKLTTEQLARHCYHVCHLYDSRPISASVMSAITDNLQPLEQSCRQYTPPQLSADFSSIFADAIIIAASDQRIATAPTPAIIDRFIYIFRRQILNTIYQSRRRIEDPADNLDILTED